MQSLNQQPVPTLYRAAPVASMANADAVNRACDELRARFSKSSAYHGLQLDDTSEGVTITVNRDGLDVSTFTWQSQCNEIERALRIGAPMLDLMIVVA